MSLVQAPSLKCFFSPGPEMQPTVKNLYPKVETVPARKPAATAPKGVSIISLDVPTTTPPASAAFWMWTYGDKKRARYLFRSSRPRPFQWPLLSSSH